MEIEMDTRGINWSKVSIPFKGFDKENIVLRVVPDSGGKHDHLEISINGVYKGYLHIDKRNIYCWTRDKENSHEVHMSFDDAM